MLPVSAADVGSIARDSTVRPGGPHRTDQFTPARSQSDPTPEIRNSLGLSRSDLLAMHAGIDQASRTSNALSTAGDAIGVIGGLLGNIQTALTAAGSSADASVDSAAEQTRIDSAITTIDAIASSSRFGGKQLLNGTFNVSSSTGAIAIPSFVSSTLGSSTPADVGAPALSSLRTGGSNDLATGNLDAAGKIVTGAIGQVDQTQAQINHVLTATRAGSDGQIIDTGGAPSTDMLADPFAATGAAANSSAQRVLALLGP
jgi:flagellin-like hook-associated protein FlgL